MVDASGYLLRFKMRKSGLHVNLFNLCKDFIDTLLPFIPGSYIIYSDNYYGSLDLAEYCNMIGFGFIFTMRDSKPSWFWNHVHSNLEDTPFGKWTMMKSKNGIHVTSWEDKGKKPTNFISNLSCKPFVETERKSKGTRKKTSIPEVSILYNQGINQG